MLNLNGHSPSIAQLEEVEVPVDEVSPSPMDQMEDGMEAEMNAEMGEMNSEMGEMTPSPAMEAGGETEIVSLP